MTITLAAPAAVVILVIVVIVVIIGFGLSVEGLWGSITVGSPKMTRTRVGAFVGAPLLHNFCFRTA